MPDLSLSVFFLVLVLIAGSLLIASGVFFSILFILEIIFEPKVKFLRTITDDNNHKFFVYSYGNIFNKKQFYALEKDLHTPPDFIYTEEGELVSYSEKKAIQEKIFERLKTENKIKQQIVSAENNFIKLGKSRD